MNTRKYIGIKPTYVIVGLDEDGIEHFIGLAHQCSWIIAFIRTIRFKFTYRYRHAFKKIYMKGIYV